MTLVFKKNIRYIPQNIKFQKSSNKMPTVKVVHIIRLLTLFSDRNELMRERERDRERGYLSDHNSRYSLFSISNLTYVRELI